MINFALTIAGKDIRLFCRNTGSFIQALLFGLTLIFIFSISIGTGNQASPQEAASIFWLSTIFCQILLFNQLYNIEEINLSRDGLMTSPNLIQGIWLGKALAGLPALCIAQVIFLPAIIIFLNQHFSDYIIFALISLFLTDIGLCAAGSLLGAICRGQSSRDALMSIILFPLLMPLLLSSITVCSQSIGAPLENRELWLGIACSFDAIFLAAGLLLFGFLYKGED